MASQSTFCNVPWTNLHVYWDGGFGVCCSEAQRPYNENDWSQYNLKNYTVKEWFNSEPILNFRKNILNGEPLSACKPCYHEEENGYESKRIRENFKTIIFTKQAFDKSYIQSPWHNRFESSKHNALQNPPIDWHIDFGNECNLACKMCSPYASSLIASKYKKWGLISSSRKNWTSDENAWKNIFASIDQIPVKRLHFMGGEVLLNKGFHRLIDYLLENNRTEISLSFVTNGTLLTTDILDKLKKFKNVDLEISIESITGTNAYIRQGGTSDKVFDTLKEISKLQTDTFKVVMRSVPQLLNVNNYDEYIKWAWENKISVQGILLSTPSYLAITVLPLKLRQGLIPKYQQVIEYIKSNPQTTFAALATGRDTSRLDLQLINEANTIINLLNSPEPHNVNDLRKDLATWLMRWDKEYNLNAYDYYPEYSNFLKEIGYEV